MYQLDNECRGAQADEGAGKDAQAEHGQAVDAERETKVGGCGSRLEIAFGLVEVHQLDHAQVVETADDSRNDGQDAQPGETGADGGNNALAVGNKGDKNR